MLLFFSLISLFLVTFFLKSFVSIGVVYNYNYPIKGLFLIFLGFFRKIVCVDDDAAC